MNEHDLEKRQYKFHINYNFWGMAQFGGGGVAEILFHYISEQSLLVGKGAVGFPLPEGVRWRLSAQSRTEWWFF